MSKMITFNELKSFKDFYTLQNSMESSYANYYNRTRRRIRRYRETMQRIRLTLTMLFILAATMSVVAAILGFTPIAVVNTIIIGITNYVVNVKCTRAINARIKKIIDTRYTYALKMCEDKITKYTLLHNVDQYEIDKLLLKTYNFIRTYKR